ncbi:hypothetical protein KIN20_009712, partial [Parelaphostrongylus tenuis]
MITFLNVKSDWRLRAAFFESLPICVQKNSFDVKPLLQQGLHDFEELVVVHAIHCITVLIETAVLGRKEVLELLEDTLPFLSHPGSMTLSGWRTHGLCISDQQLWTVCSPSLHLQPQQLRWLKRLKRLESSTPGLEYRGDGAIHSELPVGDTEAMVPRSRKGNVGGVGVARVPGIGEMRVQLSPRNEWIRFMVIELLVLLDSRWTLADTLCRLLPMVRPYLSDTTLLRLNNKLVILSCLKSPIPRDIWKKVTEMTPEQTEAFQMFLDRGTRGGAITCNDSWFIRVFVRDTLEPDLFEKLSRFSRLLRKMAEFRKT